MQEMSAYFNSPSEAWCPATIQKMKNGIPLLVAYLHHLREMLEMQEKSDFMAGFPPLQHMGGVQTEEYDG